MLDHQERQDQMDIRVWMDSRECRVMMVSLVFRDRLESRAILDHQVKMDNKAKPDNQANRDRAALAIIALNQEQHQVIKESETKERKQMQRGF